MKRQSYLASLLELSSKAIESRQNKNLPETLGDSEQKSSDNLKVVHEPNWVNIWEGPMPAIEWLRPSFFGNFALNIKSSSYGARNDKPPRTRRDTSCAQYHLQIRPPSWLTQRAWDIVASNSYSGFKLCLKAYSIVPHNALVFQCARLGDIDGLLDLFNKKLASPFDRNEYGESLIDVS